MDNSHRDRKLYEPPQLVEFGDIGKLTSANLTPGRMDWMYYQAIMNNSGGGTFNPQTQFTLLGELDQELCS